MSSERLCLDPILVGGTLVGGRFEGRGFVIREGFERHPRVVHWLRKWGNPTIHVLPQRAFEDLAHEGIGA